MRGRQQLWAKERESDAPVHERAHDLDHTREFDPEVRGEHLLVCEPRGTEAEEHQDTATRRAGGRVRTCASRQTSGTSGGRCPCARVQTRQPVRRERKQGADGLVRLVDAFGRDLQLVLKPEHVLALAFGMGPCGPEERLELGRGYDPPQTSRGAQEIVARKAGVEY